MSTRFVALLTACALAPPAAAQNPAEVAASGWAALTKADVQALHDILAANHPGPADPQNPAYGQRLAEGRRVAWERAGVAKSYGDYIRTLRAYTNSFQDGHITLSADLSPSARWPRFAVAADANGARVTEADPTSGVTVGTTVIACDGQSVEALMTERVDPYWWNIGIPHERPLHTYRLFLSASGDEARELKSCRVRTPEGEEKNVALTWTGLDSSRLRNLASGGAAPRTLGLKRVDDVWIVTLPTFQYTQEQAAEATRLVEELKTRSPELADSILVFDVRGNRGGNSAWGSRMVRAVWGDDLVNHVVSGFDNTVDYRVSASNLAALEANIVRARRDGLDAAVQSGERVRDAMAAALARGDAYVNVPSPPRRASDDPVPATPFRGRAYLLTDNACASACLDFADIMRRLPGVTHIGDRTSGDAVYIDNTRAALPSGLSALSYSLKVYRNRVRGNNVWYEPQIGWPETPLTTDDALVAWVHTLSR